MSYKISKVFISCFLIFAFSPFTFSQIRLGAHFGSSLNLTNISSSPASDLSGIEVSGFGHHGGVFVEYQIDKEFTVMGELNVNGKSYNSVLNETEQRGTQIYTVENYTYANPIYVETPILAKYNLVFRKGKYGQPNNLGLYAGAVVGFQFMQNYKSETTFITTVLNQTTVERFTSEDVAHDIQPLDVSLALGAAFDFGFGLRAGLRAQLAFMDASASEEITIKNHQVMVSLGYRLFQSRKWSR